MKNHLTVAVTGGIGSGKSYLINVLKEKGFSTLSCDEIARDIFNLKKIKKELKILFPTAVSGKIFMTIDRQKIADIVFHDKEQLKKLNALTHPVIVEETIKRSKKMPSPVFVEVPLLFEGNYQYLFDKVVVVTRDKTQRIQSVMDRSNLTEDAVKRRMDNQVDYDTLDLSNYIVINNDGTKECFDTVLYTLLQDLSK